MRFRLKACLLAAGILAGLAAPGTGRAVTLGITWTGSSGYSMTGQFSFADALLGTGVITGADLTGFASGNVAQSLCVNGTSGLGAIAVASSTLEAVPEPAPAGLFGFGIASLARLRRRHA